jgi:c-di-GMP-binding flagellar brake protein YcgR
MLSVSENNADNRRRHIRVDMPLLVEYRQKASEVPQLDYALNISRRGMLLSATEEIPAGTELHIRLTSRDAMRHIEGTGRVIRHTAAGCAIELDGFSEEDAELIEGMVYHSIQQRERLEKGFSPQNKNL